MLATFDRNVGEARGPAACGGQSREHGEPERPRDLRRRVEETGGPARAVRPNPEHAEPHQGWHRRPGTVTRGQQRGQDVDIVQTARGHPRQEQQRPRA